MFLQTRTTLTEVSKTDITSTITGLSKILDELSTQFGPIRSRPEPVLQSELYIVELLADCCRAHWDNIRDVAADGDRSTSPSEPTTNGDGRLSALARPNSSAQGRTSSAHDNPSYLDDPGDPWRARNTHDIVPPSLADSQVMHLLGILTYIVTPIPDDYQIPTSASRDLGFLIGPKAIGNRNGESRGRGGTKINARLDRAAFQIMEYLSASNWSLVLNHIQNKLRILRALPMASGSSTNTGSDAGPDPEASVLIGLQVMAHLWVNRRKLSVLVQELCGCFLNLQKAAQNAIAVLLPETIGCWIDNNPDEFVQLHTTEKRLDGGCEFLFDMSNSMAEDVRLNEFLWPFQTSLVLLIPEAFWVAGNMQDARNGSVAKKASFLEGLRQSLRSSRSSSTAASCLVGICKVAHHFPSDSDAALLSYALDVQLEVREEVFKPAPSDEERSYDLYLMVSAIVSLCHLNLDSILEHMIPWGFDNDSLVQVKLAVFHSCAIMARQPDAEQYKPLFAAVGPHCRAFLLVSRSKVRLDEQTNVCSVPDRMQNLVAADVPRPPFLRAPSPMTCYAPCLSFLPFALRRCSKTHPRRRQSTTNSSAKVSWPL